MKRCVCITIHGRYNTTVLAYSYTKMLDYIKSYFDDYCPQTNSTGVIINTENLNKQFESMQLCGTELSSLPCILCGREILCSGTFYGSYEERVYFYY